MVATAEELYGPYRWERYDLLVLPPSFPFGGMENPRLTFVTPTILAGDRSLTSLVAHELAHSWSGNLVTNATWNDFWLNEGFTVYFERRIMEQLYGRPYADMLQALGHSALLHTVQEIGPASPDTHLRLNLAGRDPDEGLTEIAYEKGDCLLTPNTGGRPPRHLIKVLAAAFQAWTRSLLLLTTSCSTSTLAWPKSFASTSGSTAPAFPTMPRRWPRPGSRPWMQR
jgi:hypothetical protein